MRKQPDGTFLFSPKDLVTFLEGDFAEWMDRRYAENRSDSAGPFTWTPDEDDPEDDLVKRRGMEHEAAVLEILRTRHGTCIEIPHDDTAQQQTLVAMRGACPLIYQGRLGTDNWHGYPDFLVRTQDPSRLGDWSYWPMDSKLARSAKPYFLIQLCAYAHYLEAVQGTRPRELGFIFGNRIEQRFDTERFFHFYRYLKDTFSTFQNTFDADAMPDPALEAGFGRWDTAAKAILEERDDLRLVARITRSQIKRLRDQGIATRAQLIAANRPLPRFNPDVLKRLRRQARLQVASKGKALPDFEVLPPETGRRTGLAALPPASAGDVFFDLEGFPLAENGLEYLFGAVTLEDGQPRFHDWWAHDEAAEKAAFEQTVDWLHARWKADPAMHVYHYADYEVTALRKLMGRYATREREVDDLLRANAFVDLLAITRAGVAIGTTGYSLKDIEVLISPPRTALVTSASSSIVEYQRWMDSGEPGDWKSSPILGAIRDYNREDCESTWCLAAWLRGLQQSSNIPYIAIETDLEDEDPAEDVPHAADLLAAGLLARASAEADPERKRVTELVAWLTNYHRREDKPMWWRYFSRLGATHETSTTTPTASPG